MLYRELGLPGGVTAFVGGGGKTTLIGVLARELAARHTVLIATTTHIYPPACPVLISPTAREVLSAFEDERTVAVGSEAEDGKLGALPELQRLYPVLADAALVEADGARRLPLKAPAEHEPVIPREARLVVAVLGLDGIGKPIAEAAHRPEQSASDAAAHSSSCSRARPSRPRLPPSRARASRASAGLRRPALRKSLAARR